MKRAIGVVTAALASLYVFSGTALAGCSSYPPCTAPPPTVLGTVEHNGGGTAFTGANISVGLVILVTLVVIGAAALLVARRRAAART